MFKYLAAFFIPHSERICLLADKVAKETGLHPLHLWIPPHVSFLYRVMEERDEDTLKAILTEQTMKIRSPRMVISGRLGNFGRRHLVLYVQPSLAVAGFWVGVQAEFARQLPAYEHGEYNSDNTLHASVAKVLPKDFDHVWPTVKKFEIDTTAVALTRIDLLRKPADEKTEKWRMVQTFHIPSALDN
jgi:hypothetical protein